jgi:hypothetical protein
MLTALSVSSRLASERVGMKAGEKGTFIALNVTRSGMRMQTWASHFREALVRDSLFFISSTSISCLLRKTIAFHRCSLLCKR